MARKRCASSGCRRVRLALKSEPPLLRALDLEGEQVAKEPTDSVGPRHRSVYHLCDALPKAVTVVVSQDGGARFIIRKDGAVTYWDQA